MSGCWKVVSLDGLKVYISYNHMSQQVIKLGVQLSVSLGLFFLFFLNCTKCLWFDVENQNVTWWFGLDDVSA